MRGAAVLLMLALALAREAPHPLANPVECQASEYLDGHGKCAPCRECEPGLELSKECGFGEGGDSQCMPCRPRRFKDSWGHHGCKPCLSCSLINRLQKTPCTATSDAACGDCFPGFYSKTQIGGLQDLECVPCTKRTSASEPQCHSRAHLEKVENPAGPTLDAALVGLTCSALVIIVLVSLLSLLYCQQFWKSQCQRVLLQRRDFSGQRVTFQASAGPAGFSHLERLPNPCRLNIRSCSPRQGPLEEMQRRWPHAPVECTELDLQNFSPRAGMLCREDAEMRTARGTRQDRAAAAPACCGDSGAEARALPLGSPHSPYSSFRNPAAESGEQMQSEDARSLVMETRDVTEVSEDRGAAGV